MSDSNPKTVYQRLIITGQNVTSEVKHDSEKRKNRVTTSTRPISMKTKIISSPISDTRNRKAGTQNEEKSQHGKGKKKKEEKMLKVGVWNMPVSPLNLRHLPQRCRGLCLTRVTLSKP